jgi:DNA-binding NarL/FixJ family response regulator
MTRVLLADDQELMRMGFRMVIDSQPDLEVVGEAGTGRAAVTAVARLTPDVVLMDVRMPELDGVEATRRIVAAGVSTRVIILTTFDLDEYVHAALRAGASGFLLKDAQPADLLSAIRAVAAGDAVVAPRVTRRLSRQGRPTATGCPRSPPVSMRCSRWSPAVCPTPRSPTAWSSPRRRSRPTSAGCWPSWSSVTGCRSSSSPTRPASSPVVSDPRRRHVTATRDVAPTGV